MLITDLSYIEAPYLHCVPSTWTTHGFIFVSDNILNHVMLFLLSGGTIYWVHIHNVHVLLSSSCCTEDKSQVLFKFQQVYDCCSWLTSHICANADQWLSIAEPFSTDLRHQTCGLFSSVSSPTMKRSDQWSLLDNLHSSFLHITSN
jgi:hypothetical protein